MRVRRQVEEAAAWAASFRLVDAPDDVVQLSAAQIANILAAIFAGSESAAGKAVRSALMRSATPGPCTAIPHGGKMGLWDALYLHAAYANALELDDFHFRGHLGPAAAVVPLTLGEALGSSGADCLRAQIIANELGGRLGWAVTAEVRHGHQRSYLLRLAAAAAAAALLNLDETRFANALAAAMTQPEMALHPGMFSPDTKVLSAAPSVVEGVRVAFFCESGLGAALDILEHRAGFYRQFTMHREVPNPFVQFGEAWCTHALSFKRYSACGYAAGAVHAACAIRAEPAFDPEGIESVEIYAAVPALLMERLANPHEAGHLTPVNVQFSTRRAVAAALAVGDLRGFQFRKPTFESLVPQVQRLVTRIRLLHDWRLTIQQLRGIDEGLPDEGGGRSADMFQFYRTSREFRRMFGTARAIGPADIVRLARLQPDDRAYFVGRWSKSLRNHLHVRPRDPNRQVGDLRRMSWRMGGRVVVRWGGGRTLSAECIIPPGMAGDPSRIDMVKEKLFAEGDPVIGAERCRALWESLIRIDAHTPNEVVALATVPPAGAS